MRDLEAKSNEEETLDFTENVIVLKQYEVRVNSFLDFIYRTLERCTNCGSSKITKDMRDLKIIRIPNPDVYGKEAKASIHYKKEVVTYRCNSCGIRNSDLDKVTGPNLFDLGF